jgi:hypothetical protein
LIGQWVKIRTHDHTGQKLYSTPSEASRVFPPELSFFDRKTSEALGTNHLLMKPRKHIHVEYYWQTYFKPIGTLSQTFKDHIHNRWFVPSASDVFLSKNDNSGGKTREASEGCNKTITGFCISEYEFLLTCKTNIDLSFRLRSILFDRSIKMHIHFYKSL